MPFLYVDTASGQPLYDWAHLNWAGEFHRRGCRR
jgi:hypothetical protein